MKTEMSASAAWSSGASWYDWCSWMVPVLLGLKLPCMLLTAVVDEFKSTAAAWSAMSAAASRAVALIRSGAAVSWTRAGMPGLPAAVVSVSASTGASCSQSAKKDVKHSMVTARLRCTLLKVKTPLLLRKICTGHSLRKPSDVDTTN